MSENLPKSRLKSFISEIIRGYSVARFNDKKIYLKHITSLESSLVDIYFDDFFNRAVQSKIPKLEEREKDILNEGWSDKNNREIFNLAGYIDNLKVTKSQLFRSADIEKVNKTISENQEKLKKLELEKQILVGLTAENFASKKTNEYYIYTSAYKDDILKDKFFSEKDFDELDDNQIFKLTDIYNSSMTFFNTNNFRKAALSGGFLNLFYLCEDNPYIFFGKPVVELSYYQIEIFSYGRYFKNILTNAKTPPPKEVLDDPDKLVEWSDLMNNSKKMLDKYDDPDVAQKGLVGLSKEDIKRIGANPTQGVDLAEEAKKRGGMLNFREIINLSK